MIEAELDEGLVDDRHALVAEQDLREVASGVLVERGAGRVRTATK
jgi:hypothetical protein